MAKGPSQRHGLSPVPPEPPLRLCRAGRRFPFSRPAISTAMSTVPAGLGVSGMACNARCPWPPAPLATPPCPLGTCQPFGRDRATRRIGFLAPRASADAVLAGGRRGA